MNEIDNFIMKTLSEPSTYTDSYVAFLDMLGFSELCRKKILSCAEIKAKFNDIELLEMQYYNKFSKIVIPNDVRNKSTFSIMSDSIVISAPDSTEGLLYILYLCSFIQCMLLKSRILLRGGIAKGEFFKCDNVMFGPALVEAYSLESTLAIYPRVVLAESIINELKDKGAFAKKTLQDYIEKYNEIEGGANITTDHVDFTQIELLLKKSTEDSLYFVNYFNTLEMLRLKNDDEAKNIIDSVIKEGLAHENEKVRLKYHWLDEYYRNCLQGFPFVLPELSDADIQAIIDKSKKASKDNHA